MEERHHPAIRKRGLQTVPVPVLEIPAGNMGMREKDMDFQLISGPLSVNKIIHC